MALWFVVRPHAPPASGPILSPHAVRARPKPVSANVGVQGPAIREDATANPVKLNLPDDLFFLCAGQRL